MTDPGVLAQELLQKHWSKFGTVRIPCVYTSVTDGSYDTATGVSTSNSDSTYNLTVIFDEFNISNSYATIAQTKQVEVQSKDKIAIFPVLDLIVTPKINDTILDTDLVTWRVISLGSDAANVAHNLHVRPVK